MIHCKDLHIKQGNFHLDAINFKIEKGEYAVLMGKTGCGKTTVLEVICGLRKIQSGEIWLNNIEISQLSPGEREIGYVPQDGALFQHMDVAQNMGFALKIRKWDKKDIEQRVSELAGILGIGHLLHRLPQSLSGGEKQRVALGRALSFYPNILCLDEPLSALDEETKETMYDLLLTLKKNLKITVLHISHSKSEANKLADKIFRLNNGDLEE
ncbi:ATP-binding cassette domain-containing protein [Flagellimonas sp. 2504JD1-5]